VQADGYSAYLDPTVDVEVATLGLPAPEWMGLDELTDDTSAVCIAERVVSGDCNDGIDFRRLNDLLVAILSAGATMDAWLQTDQDYRKLIVDKLVHENVAGFAPFDVRTTTSGYVLNRVTEIHPQPDKEQLLQVKAGILALSLTVDELQQVGLPNTVLTFAGWNDDRIAIQLGKGSNKNMLRSFPCYAELVDNYDVAIFPAGEHGSDCVLASKQLNRSELEELAHKAMDSLKWRWVSQGHIGPDDYERMYQQSMAEERHPNHSRIDLDLE
jgi:hypothetical protein